ncbi:CCN family member 1-like isoform X5 [Channa argus]|uniref:CCN family member 1-like isoform X5 n=1 Tax=Channa argus TaxID=215402 RepID=UPI003522DDA1
MPHPQLNQRDAHVSTMVGSTRMVRASVPAVNICAPALTVLLAAPHSATISCHQFPHLARTQGWSGYLGSAASVWIAIKAPGASHPSIRCLLQSSSSPDLDTSLTTLKMSWSLPKNSQVSSPVAGRMNMATNICLVREYKRLVWSHLREKCPVQTTEWSQCSRTCGVGISSRITNKNPQCKLERETRICTIRPCHAITGTAKPQKGRKCSPTQKAPEPLRLGYGECKSVHLYRPNYCGMCTDRKCCSPRRTHTIPVTFVCTDGERFQRSVMFIQSCKCSDDCSLLNEVALPPQHWMYGDTHKFKD